MKSACGRYGRDDSPEICKRDFLMWTDLESCVLQCVIHLAVDILVIFTTPHPMDSTYISGILRSESGFRCRPITAAQVTDRYKSIGAD